MQPRPVPLAVAARTAPSGLRSHPRLRPRPRAVPSPPGPPRLRPHKQPTAPWPRPAPRHTRAQRTQAEEGRASSARWPVVGRGKRGEAARQPPPDSVGGSWRCELTVRVTDRAARRRPTAGAATPGPRRGGAGTCRPETCNGAGFCCYPVPLGVEWFSHFSELRGGSRWFR
jgi:hypothetical protein